MKPTEQRTKPAAPITGQLIVRSSSMPAPDGSGRAIVAVIGILAVPAEDAARMTDPDGRDVQYTVVGSSLERFGVVDGTGDVIDETFHGGACRGMRADQLLTALIWRV